MLLSLACGESVTIIGVAGRVGSALARCFSSRGNVQVHGYNREYSKVQALRGLPNVKIHHHLADALKESQLVIMAVTPDAHLHTAHLIIDSEDSRLWRDRHLVQFTTHGSFAAREQSELLTSLGGQWSAAALVGLPSSICTEEAVYMVSGSEPKKVEKLLRRLRGRVMPLGSEPGAVGALNAAVVQSLYFGVMGYRVGHMLLQKYTRHFGGVLEQTFANLMETPQMDAVAHSYRKVARQAMETRDWDAERKAHMSVDVLFGTLEVGHFLMQRLGMEREIFLSEFLGLLNDIPHRGAPSQMLELYVPEEQKSHDDTEL